MPEVFATMAGGLTARFDTARDIRAHALHFGAHIPAFAFTGAIADKADIDLGDVTLPDAYHLLYGHVRKALLARDNYPVHAACVGHEAGYALLVGHSGSGKTTLTEKLLAQGYKLYSGNKTVMRKQGSGLQAIAGTRTMTALDATFNRQAYLLPDAAYAPTPTVPIKNIFIVRVNDGVAEDQRLEPLSALHTLYPYFMDAVNADVIVDGKTVFDGHVDMGVKSRLVETLGRALETIPVRKISGSIAYMAQRVIAP